jgi:hypothetical protein
MRVAERRVVAEMAMVWVVLANGWWLRNEIIRRNYKWSRMY